MARKSKEQPLTIGFFGTGEVNEKEVGSLLEDYLQDKGDITFVLPATKVHFTDTMQAVIDFATDCDPLIPYEVVTDEEGSKARALAKVIKGAAKVHKVARIGQKVVSTVAAAPEGVLVVIWNDEDEDLEAVANRAVDNDLPVRDLTLGLEEVDFEDATKKDDEKEPTKDKADESEAPADDEAQPGDDEPYTREELEGADLDGEDGLKAIAKDFDLDFPPRTRKSTYVDAILKAQEAESGAAEDEEPSGKEKAKDDEEPAKKVVGVDIDDLANEIAETVLAGIKDVTDGTDVAINRLADKTGNLVDRLAAVEEWMADLGKRLDNLGSGDVGSSEEDDDTENTPDDEPAPVRRRRRRL